MGATISRYILNFAKTGTPNGGGLPQWPQYARPSDQIMDFAANGKAEPQRIRGAPNWTRPSKPTGSVQWAVAHAQRVAAHFGFDRKKQRAAPKAC
jgi:hypothetical protein